MSANLTPSKGEDQELRKAATTGDIAGMEAVLKLGANINGENNYGQRALHVAASNGQTDAVVFLLRNGANIHAKTKAGDTPLIIAARNGHPQVVDILLKDGSQPNAINSDGWTALHFAVDRCHEAVAQALLQANADPTIRTKDGKMPLDLLRDNAPITLKNLLHEASVQQEMRSPLRKGSAPGTPSMSRIASPPRVMSPEMAPRSVRANRSLMSELNAAAASEEVPVVPVAYQPVYAPMPVRGELMGSFDNAVRTSVTEKLIELVERQSAEIDVLRQEVNRLSLRVAELARVGFPHTLELKLDGRVATYHLGPSPAVAAAVAAAAGNAASAAAAAPGASVSHHAAPPSHPSTPTTSISFAPHVSSPLAAPPSSPQASKPAAARKIPFDEMPIRPAKDAIATNLPDEKP